MKLNIRRVQDNPGEVTKQYVDMGQAVNELQMTRFLSNNTIACCLWVGDDALNREGRE